MFKSLTYKRYDPKTEQYICELEDTEFGMVEVEVGDEIEVGVAVAREYSKRGLDVGKNLAVYTIWYCEEYRYTIENTCKNQDKYCPKHMPNWKEYATNRDEHLTKLLLIG